MSKIWERKMRTYFHTFDVLRQGVITEEGFKAMGLRFAESQNADAERMAKHMKGFCDIWTLWTAGAEGDAKHSLSMSAFVESVKVHLKDPEAFKTPFREAIRIMFDIIDINNDGCLQEDEHYKWFDSFGVPDMSFAKTAFAVMDVNHDGELSFDEFIDGFFEFFFSQDERNPFTLFFGPLVK